MMSQPRHAAAADDNARILTAKSLFASCPAALTLVQKAEVVWGQILITSSMHKVVGFRDGIQCNCHIIWLCAHRGGIETKKKA